MTISCIVIDDEPLALKQLEQYVNKTELLELKESFDNASDALAYLHINKIDLIYVDINMPQISGLEFVEALPFDARIVFVTAHREYALEGFVLDAADYLLKPISYASFIKSVEKVRKRYFNTSETEECKRDYIFVRSEHRTVRINLYDILYIESKREYLDITLESGEYITIHGSLNNFSDRLKMGNFLRVHRSFIVNLDKVNIIERNTIIFGKIVIPINEQAKIEIAKYTNK